MLPASELSRSRYPDNSSLSADVSQSVGGKTCLLSFPASKNGVAIFQSASLRSRRRKLKRDFRNVLQNSTKTKMSIPILIDFAAPQSNLSFHRCCSNFFKAELLIRLFSFSVARSSRTSKSSQQHAGRQCRTRHCSSFRKKIRVSGFGCSFALQQLVERGDVSLRHL